MTREDITLRITLGEMPVEDSFWVTTSIDTTVTVHDLLSSVFPVSDDAANAVEKSLDIRANPDLPDMYQELQNVISQWREEDSQLEFKTAAGTDVLPGDPVSRHTTTLNSQKNTVHIVLEQQLDALRRLDDAALAMAIERSCAIKAEIVALDETEQGVRALLNLGHTFGHAIEAEQGYGNWLHGEAVAAGIILACKTAEKLDWLTPSETRRVAELQQAFALPVEGPDTMTYSDYMRHMARDKKVEAGHIRFVIPQGIGHAVVTKEVSEAILTELLSQPAG